MPKYRNLLYTSDYIADETVALLTARRMTHKIKDFIYVINNSKSLKIQFMDPDIFSVALQFISKRLNQGYSFTDVTSFVIMEPLKIKHALTSDGHFLVAGFKMIG